MIFPTTPAAYLPEFDGKVLLFNIGQVAGSVELAGRPK